MSAEVTVAVVSWNTRELLRRCLSSFDSEADAGRCEVWVVDNASEDGSAQMVREDFPWVRLLALDSNLGFGPAVNEVARRTQAEWIAPANADVELLDGAMEALLSAGADPATGSVAPRLIMDGGETQHSVHPFPTVRLALAFALGLYRIPALGDRLCIEGYWRADVRRPVDWAHGAFLLVRRRAFDEIGGFDPGQWLYAEDVDLAWRLARAGWATRYEPQARVRHAVSAAAAKAFGGDRARRHVLATYEWQWRRQGPLAARASAAINAAGAAIRWLGFAIAGLVAPTRFGESRRRAAGYVTAHAAGMGSRASLERAIRRPTG